ncbi:MAG TPA: methyltransferase domain-containing protein, partial [Coleofasciculaceae cyanobacterium]
DGATISHFGAMLSRSTQAVRVNVEGIPPEHLLNYLIQLGWQGSKNTLSPLILTLFELVDNLVLSLDIGETIYPRIGLECFLAKQFRPDFRWHVFLNYLVANNLCTPAKQEALLAWPGFSRKADNPEVWPKSLRAGDLLLGAKALSAFWRTINLIKIVYQPDSTLEAKAYLAFGHRWFDSNTLMPKKQPNYQFVDNASEPEVYHYLERVRDYYDTMNPLILQDVGRTYQSGLLTTHSKADPYRETNLYCAAQAGIQPGYHLLDAGCGVGGPSIDIAQHIESLKIDAITLSPAQAKTARELVQQAGLTDRIQIHVGDFHYLPFADAVFDLVFFFESSGYSYDHQRLFFEVYRVLRPGGTLYIKEPFSKEPPLSNQEQQELEELNRLYVYKIPTMSEFVTAISRAGFQSISHRDLSGILSMEEINKTMFEYKNGIPNLTDFGKIHYRTFRCLPTFFGEIKAHKPS